MQGWNQSLCLYNAVHPEAQSPKTGCQESMAFQFGTYSIWEVKGCSHRLPLGICWAKSWWAIPGGGWSVGIRYFAKQFALSFTKTLTMQSATHRTINLESIGKEYLFETCASQYRSCLGGCEYPNDNRPCKLWSTVGKLRHSHLPDHHKVIISCCIAKSAIYLLSSPMNQSWTLPCWWPQLVLVACNAIKQDLRVFCWRDQRQLCWYLRVACPNVGFCDVSPYCLASSSSLCVEVFPNGPASRIHDLSTWLQFESVSTRSKMLCKKRYILDMEVRHLTITLSIPVI